MFEYLLRALPTGTWLLKSLTLAGMYGDLDILVIGRTGVVVVEVKYWAGEIWCSGDGHAWTRRKRGVLETMRDPAGQASACVRSLRAYLEREDRSLCARVRLWIEAFVVFTHPTAIAHAESSPVPVASREDVVLTIRNGRPTRELTEQEQEALVGMIVAGQDITWNRSTCHSVAAGPVVLR
jgi:hypothetical protein